MELLILRRKVNRAVTSMDTEDEKWSQVLLITKRNKLKEEVELYKRWTNESEDNFLEILEGR